VLILGVVLVWAPAAYAQSNRVFASARSGSDANLCNNILTPCQTFQGAVNQVAAGGTVIVLDSGGYGPINITKALTIDSPPGIVAFIHPPSGSAITVNAGAGDKVVLRGVALNVGGSSGIVVTSVGALYVENCTIDGFAIFGLFFGSAGQLFVKDTTAADNGVAGIWIEPASGTVKASIDRCRVERNGGAGGITAGGGVSVTIRDTVAAANFRGFQAGTANGQTLQVNVERCVSSGNVVGVFAADGAGTVVRVSDTTITNNTLFGIEAQGSGAIFSRVNNTVEGNAGGQLFSGSFVAK
jgi:hypothetical protein